MGREEGWHVSAEPRRDLSRFKRDGVVISERERVLERSRDCSLGLAKTGWFFQSDSECKSEAKLDLCLVLAKPRLFRSAKPSLFLCPLGSAETVACPDRFERDGVVISERVAKLRYRNRIRKPSPGQRSSSGRKRNFPYDVQEISPERPEPSGRFDLIFCFTF